MSTINPFSVNQSSEPSKVVQPGKVWIAGAGPGDPDLATVKVLKLLRSADIVFFDALGTDRLISQARGQTVFVGKRRGHHEMLQDEINRSMAEAAGAGKVVLRLKGGDPMVFGRGSEELDYLHERGIDAEIVPGVSSVLAAAAEAGAPLTERGVSVSCTIASGWPADKVAAVSADTGVYVMAAEALGRIALANLAAGRSPDTPVALVSSASLPQARVWHRTLGDLANGHEKFPPPLTIIVGPTARTTRIAARTERREVVWYTGLDAQLYRGEGRVLHKPLFRLSSLGHQENTDRQIDQSLHDLVAGKFQWAIFTSRWAVRSVFKRLLQLGFDTRALYRTKLAALGPTTAHSLQQRGLLCDLIPADASLTGLVAAFSNLNADGGRVFYPSGSQAPTILSDGLVVQGWQVETVTAYRFHQVADPEVNLELVDRVVFTTARAVERFCELFPVCPQHLKIELIGSAVKAAWRRLYPEALS